MVEIIMDKRTRQKQVASVIYVALIGKVYASVGLEDDDDDPHIPTINEAIIKRWSPSGLERIKKMAWAEFGKKKTKRSES